MSNYRVAIIGPGAMGLALAHLLSARGWDIVGAGVKKNTKENYKEGMEIFPVVTDDFNVLIEMADVIFITTPDDIIEKVALSLAQNNNLKGKTLIHTSGVHSSLELGSGEDYNILSLHPLRALASWRLALEALPNSYIFYEGNEGGKKVGRDMINALGAKGIAINREEKVLYHAAAVIFSNFLVTLIHLGNEILQKAGISEQEGLLAVWPLLEGTLLDIKKIGPVDALTGPIVRGDIKTIEKHLLALTEVPQEISELYKALALYNLDLAKLKGLSDDDYLSLKRLLKGEK